LGDSDDDDEVAELQAPLLGGRQSLISSARAMDAERRARGGGGGGGKRHGKLAPQAGWAERALEWWFAKPPMAPQPRLPGSMAPRKIEPKVGLSRRCWAHAGHASKAASPQTRKPWHSCQPPRSLAYPPARPPQTFFANERTFLSWLHMAVVIGSISTALLGVAGPTSTKGPAEPEVCWGWCAGARFAPAPGGSLPGVASMRGLGGRRRRRLGASTAAQHRLSHPQALCC
jgi:hypothetical protein